MISLIVAFVLALSLIPLGIFIAARNRSPRPSKGWRYIPAGVILCLIGGQLIGALLNGFIGIIADSLTNPLLGVGMSAFGIILGIGLFLWTIGSWVSSIDAQQIHGFQDPILGGFFAIMSKGLVGTAPWLKKKEGWIIKTTAEIEINIKLKLETSDGVILTADMQAICGVNPRLPMTFLGLDDESEERNSKAEKALSQEADRVANEESILYTDKELMGHASIIRKAVEDHFRGECTPLLRSMGLVFDRVTMSGFDRDDESAEAMRQKMLAKTQRKTVKQLMKIPGIRGDMALNAALAMSNQNTTRTVWSLEGLADLDPAVAQAIAQVLAQTQGGNRQQNQSNQGRGQNQGGRGRRGGRGNGGTGRRTT